MRQHLMGWKLVVGKSADGCIDGRHREFDVAKARKMIREGASTAAICEAMGLTPQTLRNRMKKLGLGYLLSDPLRVGAAKSAGQRARLAKIKGAQ